MGLLMLVHKKPYRFYFLNPSTMLCKPQATWRGLMSHSGQQPQLS